MKNPIKRNPTGRILPKVEHPYERNRRRLEEYWELVRQTAEYRYRICWAGARQIMAGKGYDPMLTIQATCDHGDDVNARFVLFDGTAVECDFREDPKSRQAVSINQWHIFKLEPGTEDEFTSGAEILQDPELRDAFDRAVAAYFDFHLRRGDKPLPVIHGG